MQVFNSYQEMEAGQSTGQFGASSMQAFQNMSPKGWKPALSQDLPPTEKGYQFQAFRQENGRREIAGCEIGGSEEDAFWVADASGHPILDDASAAQIVEALNLKYRSDAVRKARLEGG